MQLDCIVLGSGGRRVSFKIHELTGLWWLAGLRCQMRFPSCRVGCKSHQTAVDSRQGCHYCTFRDDILLCWFFWGSQSPQLGRTIGFSSPFFPACTAPSGTKKVVLRKEEALGQIQLNSSESCVLACAVFSNRHLPLTSGMKPRVTTMLSVFWDFLQLP